MKYLRLALIWLFFCFFLNSSAQTTEEEGGRVRARRQNSCYHQKQLLLLLSPPTHCRLDPLVLDGGLAPAGPQAALQPVDLPGDPLPLGAHQLHHGGRAGGRLLLLLRLPFAHVWERELVTGELYDIISSSR